MRSGRLFAAIAVLLFLALVVLAWWLANRGAVHIDSFPAPGHTAPAG